MKALDEKLCEIIRAVVASELAKHGFKPDPAESILALVALCYPAVISAVIAEYKSRELVLVQFARKIIQEYCWGNITWHGAEPDGGDMQDTAEKLGLIVREVYDPEKHGDAGGECEPGDPWYVFSPMMGEDGSD